MKYTRALLGRDRGWRAAVRFRGAALLNERWRKPRGDGGLARCPVCDGALTLADHAVHHGGEIFHPDCLRYRWTRA